MSLRVRLNAKDDSEGFVSASLQEGTHARASLPTWISGFNRLLSSISGRKRIVSHLLQGALGTPSTGIWLCRLSPPAAAPTHAPPSMPKRAASQGHGVTVFYPHILYVIHSTICSSLFISPDSQSSLYLFSHVTHYKLTLPSPP